MHLFCAFVKMPTFMQYASSTLVYLSFQCSLNKVLLIVNNASFFDEQTISHKTLLIHVSDSQGTEFHA